MCCERWLCHVWRQHVSLVNLQGPLLYLLASLQLTAACGSVTADCLPAKQHRARPSCVYTGTCVLQPMCRVLRYDTMCRWFVRDHWTHSRYTCGAYARGACWMCWQGMKGRWLDWPSALPSHCWRLPPGTRLYAPGMSSGVMLLSTMQCSVLPQ